MITRRNAVSFRARNHREHKLATSLSVPVIERDTARREQNGSVGGVLGERHTYDVGETVTGAVADVSCVVRHEVVSQSGMAS